MPYGYGYGFGVAVTVSGQSSSPAPVPVPPYVPPALPTPPPAPEVDFELTYPEVLRSAADVQALQGQFVQLGRLLQTSPVRLKLKQLP